MVCPDMYNYSSSIGVFGVIVALIFGVAFYLSNWEKRKKAYIYIASFLIVVGLLLLFSETRWFEVCKLILH